MLRRPTYGCLHTIAPAHIATRKGRTSKVTTQVAAPGAESAVYDCFVLASCISKHVSLGTLAGLRVIGVYRMQVETDETRISDVRLS